MTVTASWRVWCHGDGEELQGQVLRLIIKIDTFRVRVVVLFIINRKALVSNDFLKY